MTYIFSLHQPTERILWSTGSKISIYNCNSTILSGTVGSTQLPTHRPVSPEMPESNSAFQMVQIPHRACRTWASQMALDILYLDSATKSKARVLFSCQLNFSLVFSTAALLQEKLLERGLSLWKWHKIKCSVYSKMSWKTVARKSSLKCSISKLHKGKNKQPTPQESTNLWLEGSSSVELTERLQWPMTSTYLKRVEVHVVKDAILRRENQIGEKTFLRSWGATCLT